VAVRFSFHRHVTNIVTLPCLMHVLSTVKRSAYEWRHQRGDLHHVKRLIVRRIIKEVNLLISASACFPSLSGLPPAFPVCAVLRLRSSREL
jgi:hypothetical protein